MLRSTDSRRGAGGPVDRGQAVEPDPRADEVELAGGHLGEVAVPLERVAVLREGRPHRVVHPVVGAHDQERLARRARR